MGVTEYVWLTSVRRQLQIHRPLDFLPYDKSAAKEELIRRYGFKDYGAKHQESRFTKFYQEIYLPARYGFDKRRLHLSSQIVSGQRTRADALAELAQPLHDPDTARRETAFVAKKLGISADELGALIALPPKEHGEYGGSAAVFNAGASVKRWLRRRAAG
jgi:hypothetical protein